MSDGPLPTPTQLARTYRGLERLARAANPVIASGGTWAGLVEGKRCVAVLTANLARLTGQEEYQQAWNRMLEEGRW